MRIPGAVRVVNARRLRVAVVQVDEVNFDCQGEFGPGQRCLVQPAANAFSQGSIGCVSMECSPDGRVLVNGSPCDDGAHP